MRDPPEEEVCSLADRTKKIQATKAIWGRLYVPELRCPALVIDAPLPKDAEESQMHRSLLFNVDGGDAG
jgi:hypothetical protein